MKEKSNATSLYFYFLFLLILVIFDDFSILKTKNFFVSYKEFFRGKKKKPASSWLKNYLIIGFSTLGLD
jgi:hypothetical protein